jgi:hypothetical protein
MGEQTQQVTGPDPTGDPSGDEKDVSVKELGYVPQIPSKASFTGEDIKLAHEDRMRGWLALTLLVIFAGTAVWGFYSANGDHWANAKDLLSQLLPAEAGLLGTAVTFYYTQRK